MLKASTQRLIIILGSFGLMIGTVYMALSLIYPAFLDIQSLRAERQAKIDLKKSQDDAALKIGGLSKQYESLATTQDAFSLMLPITARGPALMNQLQGIARNNFMTLTALSFQYLPIKQVEKTIIQGVGTLRFNMTLSGTYDEMKAFVAQLETNVRVIDLNSLQVEGGAVPRKDTLEYNLIGDAYYQTQ